MRVSGRHLPEHRFELSAVVVVWIGMALFIWLAVEVALGRTAAFDLDSRAALHSIATPGLTLLMRAATVLGSQAVLLGATACVVLIMLREGQREEAGLIAAALAGASLILAILKLIFHRPRPEPFFGIVDPVTYSFPSGHALLSLCCYGVLVALAGAKAPRGVRWMAAVLILAIGISRVYLGVHYTSDVIGGYLAGSVWMAALFVAASKLKLVPWENR
jgi:undecaprenyl-diphosphatase